MKVCIIGDGLTSLSLAKILINKKINTHIYCKKKSNNLLLSRTIGISKDNLEFFKKKILDVKKNIWKIKKIEIFSEKINTNKILDFGNNINDLFFMIKNNDLYKLLKKELSKSKLFQNKIIKNDSFYQELLKKNEYDLIVNCDDKNYISKKYFSKKIKKSYNNFAYTTILNHNELKNNTAVQVFTKYGPIAYLPLSKNETSVVYSINYKINNFNEKKIIYLIKKYNTKLTIKKINKLNKFELKLSNLRNYYFSNILAFGDCLHKIHPFAGQGLNMTIRDIRVISNIIQNKIDHGLQLDSSILNEFEKKTRHINFLFSFGIDSIFEMFNFNTKIKNQNLNKMINLLGKNKVLNNIFIKFADRGLFT